MKSIAQWVLICISGIGFLVTSVALIFRRKINNNEAQKTEVKVVSGIQKINKDKMEDDDRTDIEALKKVPRRTRKTR